MKKTLVFLLIAAAAALVTFLLYRQPVSFVHHVELKLKDARFRIRGPVTPPAAVVVVAIDNKSIKEIGRWPWSREIVARLIDNLATYGAKVTALDIVFSEPQGEAPDRALARAIASAGNVVLGYFFRNEKHPLSERAVEQVGEARVKLLRIDEGVNSVPLTEFTSMDPNIPLLGEGALDFGFFNAMPDSDGLFRKTPLLLLYNGDIYPSLALKALRRYLGSEIIVDVAGFGIRGVAIGERNIPSDEHGELSLNFYGPSGAFPTISAVDIIKKRLPAGALKEKLVFVGATEIGIYDLRATPFDNVLPGVELHATMAGNTLEQRFLKRDSRIMALEIFAIFFLPIALALLLTRVSSTLAGFALSLLTGGLFLAGNYVLFSAYLFDMSVIYPLFGIALTSIGSETYRNLVVERKGRYLKKAFSNYVSAELVANIMKHPDALKLGGEKREVSILFSDIRGFTAFSERLSPEELVKLLNEYLSPMTRIVMEERGTLDKYIGDAIMALYNAPLDVDEHPTHACRTAARMIARLAELNAGFTRREMLNIEVGIGINTGDAIVGNMGADIRFDYTAIGDNVNLASRLEGLNKYYGTHILVSETTRRRVHDDSMRFREIDIVRVKGKQQPIAIYELMTGQVDFKGEFEKGLKLYRKREFDQALALFSSLSDNDPPSRLYAERCREFLAAPPPVEWDGVFTARSK